MTQSAFLFRILLHYPVAAQENNKIQQLSDRRLPIIKDHKEVFNKFSRLNKSLFVSQFVVGDSSWEAKSVLWI